MLCAGTARADHDHAYELLDKDRPEAWAMAYMSASTLMTAAGSRAELAPGQWRWAADLAQIPRLSDAQRRIGFNGLKQEDLNKSPVFGRVRAALGLPAGWLLELGYSPPVRINGARPRDLFAIALSRKLIQHRQASLTARVLGQHGGVGGDITCPERLAGLDDRVRNPYGCQAPSRDRVSLNQYGLSLLAEHEWAGWRWHGEFGAVRGESEVHVDALVYDFRDRSHLVANHWRRYLALGLGRPVGKHWRWTAEVLHQPLSVRRGEGQPRQHDDFTGLRLQLAYRR